MSDYNDEGLDLTSEPFQSESKNPSQQDAKRLLSEKQEASRKRDMIRVLFRCCNLYTTIPMPVEDAVTFDPYWNAHCPRCGRTTAIPRASHDW